MCGYPGDREAALIAYVYDETTPEERAAFDVHLASCAQCRAELAAVTGVRQRLAHWSPPEFVALSRAIAEPAAPPARRRSGWREMPAWAQVAAAMLVVGVSAGIANLDVHYDKQSGLNLRTGWQRVPQNPANALNPANAVNPLNPGSVPWRADLTALEQQLRREMHTAPAADGPALVRASSSNDAELMRRFRALVDESEKRQQRELALRVTALIQDLNAQRQADLRKIDQNLGLIQNRTGVEVLRNRQMIDYYLQRVSQRP
jgi:putative zinc finger protein